MSAKRHGANAYLRGVDGKWTNARVQSRDTSQEFDNTDFALDELGRRIEAYQDDITETMEVELIYTASFAKLAMGAEVEVVLTLDENGDPDETKSYVVDKINDSHENRGWRKYKVTLVDWEYVDRS
jgi:hypothetical protein